MEQKNIAITFCAGVGSVTGANFLLEIPLAFSNPDETSNQENQGRMLRIVVDCGLEQGSEEADLRNREAFMYDPAEIDILLITHAHTDHIGRIGKMVKDGFKGVIYSTPATLDLAKVMIPDSVHHLAEWAQAKGVLPLYEQQDVVKTFELWETIPYYQAFQLVEGVSVFLKDSGHILGSCMFEITALGKKVVFTGDLGNSPSLFLRDTDQIIDAHYMVMESVYGDRNHEPKEERRQKFVDIIKEVIAKKKTLLIPVFSLERTQDILFELNELIEHRLVGDIKVYLDSPLATKVTDVYKHYSSDFNVTAKDILQKDNDVFSFHHLRNTLDRQDSEHIDHTVGPKIIMAGSGMSNGGRIVRHEKQYLPDPNASILLVGYQASGTLGRKILDGTKELEIDGETIKVRADLKSIMGYSSHKDSDNLVEFASHTAQTAKKIFVAMGEPKAALFLVQRLRDYLGVNAVYPRRGERVELK